MLTELSFRPGVIKDEETYTARGAATDSQLIRWVRGRAEALGGWTEELDGIQGTVRAMHEWTLVDGRPNLAIATTKKLYVYDGDRLLDITPGRLSASLGSNPLATTIATRNVDVTHTAHGAVLGDTVYMAGASAVAGIQLGGTAVVALSGPFTTTRGSGRVKVTHSLHGLSTNDFVIFTSVGANVGGILIADFAGTYRILRINDNEFQIELSAIATSTATGGGTVNYDAYKPHLITRINSANSYRIVVSSNVASASSTTTGGGSSIAVIYDINVGRESSAPQAGFGSGVFGSGLFGFGEGGIIDQTPFLLRQWSLDNFGNNLVACISGGTAVTTVTRSIFIWPFSVSYSARATPLTNAPDQVTCIVTTPERFLLACGCTNEDGDFDPMLVRHTTGEDPTVWVAASDNSAGDFPVSGGSQIVGVVRRENGPLIFTDGGLNNVRSVFSPDQIYKAEQVGVDCGLMAIHAVAQRDGDVYWITPAFQFYVFRGGRPVALENPNREWFEQRINNLQTGKVFAWPDRRFEAVAFHYAAGDDVEPGDYLRLDIPEARRDPEMGWSVGTMNRTAVSAGYVFPTKKPLAASSGGKLYLHENGFADAGVAIDRYVQWAPIDLRDGATRVGIRRIQIETEQSEDITVLLGFREWPRGPASTRTMTITPTTEKYDTRGAGRQVDMRISQTGSSYWRVGTIRADMTETTRR